MNMKPLAIALIVNEGYQEYLPLYLHFLFRAYRDYEVFIYFQGQMHREVSECLERVSDLGKFVIKPLTLPYNESRQQMLKALRWVLFDEEFYDFNNVYIGDVDMFIVREDPPLHELHERHSDEIGLPYSNRVRTGQRRLTGLHFMRTRTYFDGVLPTITKYRKLIADDSLNIGNEEMLHRMMEESVGLPRVVGNFVTHHGMHARAFSTYQDLAAQRARSDFVFTRHFEPYARAFAETASTPLCTELLRTLSTITYSRQTLSHYSDAGPAVGKQIEVILSLCRELESERSAKESC